MKLELTKNGASSHLAVVVHGLGTRKLTKDVVTVIASELPDTDIATASYDSRLFSNSPADQEAHELALEIGRKVEDRAKDGQSYSSIILVGHSIGALLLRAAYLMAAGYRIATQRQLTQQAWARPAPEEGSEKNKEGPYVERLVLLSGLNNGWTTPEAKQLGRFKRIKSAIITLLITWTSFRGKAQFMRTVMRGSPFVVDVRLNWLQMIGRTPRLEPQTLHLVGETDDLIKSDDLYDFTSGKNFKHREVKNTRHYDLGVIKSETVNEIRKDFREKNKLTRWFFGWLLPTYNISENPGGERHSELKQAISSHWDVIKCQIAAGSQPPFRKKTDVVIIRHGIRDDPLGWVTNLSKAIAQHPSSDGIAAEKRSYGRFSMLQFILRGARIRRVYDFMDEYVDLRAKYPKANFHFFGHSYGTYIGCKALKEYRSCCFKHVVLANAVVASDFPWQAILTQHQADKVLNLRGTYDFVVAWFPGAFQAWREMWGSNKPAATSDLLGSAGFTGFYSDLEDGAIKGAHGAGVQDANFPAVAKFLISGGNDFANKVEKNGFVALISRIPFIVWIAILAAGFKAALLMGFPWGLLVPVILVVLLHFV